MKAFPRLLLLFILAFALCRFPGFITGCANIVPPTGGPRDSLPPVLVKAQPGENATSFTGKQILLTFDEYLDLKDIRKNLIVSPLPRVAPNVSFKLRNILIELKDTLRPNTTYYFDFGNAVTDNHEGNILRHFSYSFTTGYYLDSLSLSGNVVMAQTGKPDSTLSVVLHEDLDDSAAMNKRPRYVTRLDSLGNYTFHRLREGRYALYALKDESGSYELNSKAQIFAFADSPVNLTRNGTAPRLFAYQDTSSYKTAPKKPVAPVTPSKPKKKDPDKIERMVVTTNLTGGRLDLLDSFQLGFPVPFRKFDSTKVVFMKDSVTAATGYYFKPDSLNKKMTLVYNWEPDHKYVLILARDFAEDTLGLHLLKTDTLTFSTKKESDYGNLVMRFRGVDFARHPVLLFLQGEKIMMSYRFTRTMRYTNKLVRPGDYDLRILYDNNQDGVWTPGDFFNHVQPEIETPIRRKLTVRSNWDNEVDISL